MNLYLGYPLIMTTKYWKITEIVERYQIDRRFLDDLEEEEIICPFCRESSSDKLLSDDELEKLRFARVLHEEMDVNLPGIDVILHMRQNMLDMRNQFDDILEDLASRFQDKMKVPGKK